MQPPPGGGGGGGGAVLLDQLQNQILPHPDMRFALRLLVGYNSLHLSLGF